MREVAIPAFAGATTSYSVTVNGTTHSVNDSWLGESLLFVLRERLGLTGTKNACEQGECSSCLVYIDDELACSCCVLAADAGGRSVTTIEGRAVETFDIQRALVTYGAVQCGFCTPGFVIAIKDLLQRNPHPSVLQIQEGLSGNLCRCTGYGAIIRAVKHLIEERDRG